MDAPVGTMRCQWCSLRQQPGRKVRREERVKKWWNGSGREEGRENRKMWWQRRKPGNGVEEEKDTTAAPPEMPPCATTLIAPLKGWPWPLECPNHSSAWGTCMQQYYLFNLMKKNSGIWAAPGLESSESRGRIGSKASGGTKGRHQEFGAYLEVVPNAFISVIGWLFRSYAAFHDQRSAQDRG